MLPPVAKSSEHFQTGKPSLAAPVGHGPRLWRSPLTEQTGAVCTQEHSSKSWAFGFGEWTLINQDTCLSQKNMKKNET